MAEEKVTLSQEEFNSWLAHPVTQALRQSAKVQCQEIMVDWLNGSFTGASADETIQMNSDAIGRGRIWALISELEFEDIQGAGK